jgi:superfamily II DNA or RNA helicase
VEQVTQDQQYFQRVKWQYMILDEAQNIKNSSSVRWKTLLGFQCRNRLLLTGTPIQNSMQGPLGIFITAYGYLTELCLSVRVVGPLTFHHAQLV